jgi:hypothetical protein
MVSLPAGDHDGSSKQIVNNDLERGDHLRIVCEEVAPTPPEDVTIHIDRRFDGSTDDSGGGGGE